VIYTSEDIYFYLNYLNYILKMYPMDLTKTVPSDNENRNVFLNDGELDKIALLLVGSQQRFRENIIIPRLLGPVQIKTIEEKRIESVMESCAFKSIMSCVIGIYSITYYMYI